MHERIRLCHVVADDDTVPHVGRIFPDSAGEIERRNVGFQHTKVTVSTALSCRDHAFARGICVVSRQTRRLEAWITHR